MPAREAALRLAARFHTTVCVTCGIHIDGATPEDLKAFLAAFDELMEKIAAPA